MALGNNRGNCAIARKSENISVKQRILIFESNHSVLLGIPGMGVDNNL
jgi:hypothetical protein